MNMHPKLEGQLPPIEVFRLDRILGELNDEFVDVADALKTVASNYQADLKQEIRNKLSIEQRIQHKNIELSRMAHSLHKKIRLDDKKLRLVDLPNDVGELVSLSMAVTNSINTVVGALRNIERTLGVNEHVRFPLVNALVGEVDREDTVDFDVDEDYFGDEVELPRVTRPEETSPDSLLDDVLPNESRGEELSGVSQRLRKPGSLSTSSPKSETASIDTLSDIVSGESSQKSHSPVLEDPAEFELFMTENIAQFRTRRPRRKPSVPVPIQLLHLAKSLATVELTPLVSLFKKLRINGNPITPLKDCACDPTDPIVDEEVWISSGINSEDDELQGLSSSSDDSDQDDVTSHTNQIYLALQRTLKKQNRRRFRKLTSPTPKHQPSHRTLKPKGSILKMPKHAESPTTVARATIVSGQEELTARLKLLSQRAQRVSS